MNKKPIERTCRVCGCTDNDCRQCIAKTGHPCYWVEEDLCSACCGLPEDVRESLAELKAFNTVFGDHFNRA